MTAAIGRIARGNDTLFIRLPLSMIEPVDIIAALAKKFHASMPSSRKKTKPCTAVRMTNVKASV